MGERPRAKKRPVRRRQLALLLPAHNEELLIAATIRSAITAGQRRDNIYVVDDASTDDTHAQARQYLPERNILTVERSGKAGAVRKAIAHFDLEKRYTWLHIADADSLFCPDYFHIYRARLQADKYAAAVGFVQSMRGNWIATYRCLNYTYGQHIFRRAQGWLGMISVMPGPVSCFRTDILPSLDFQTGSVTEDLDLTLQIHRQKLGAIVFIPEAVNFTQDPKTVRAFINQTLRWQRGFFQGVRRYRLCTQPQRIDICIALTFFEVIMYMLQVSVILPYLLFVSHNMRSLVVIILTDLGILLALALLSAIAAKRVRVLIALFYYHPLRILEVGIFMVAMVEILALKRLQTTNLGWETANRRYSIDENALRDAAQ